MATKTTPTRKPKVAKTVATEEKEVTQIEQIEAVNGDASEKKKKGSDNNSGAFDDVTLNIGDLKDMSISELTHIAKEMGIDGATGLRKQELIFKVLAAQTEVVRCTGAARTVEDGLETLRRPPLLATA